MAGRQFNFSVDGNQFHTGDQIVTGATIKRMAGVGPNFGLFLEGKGHAPDRQVGDSEAIDLALPGHERFYTTPPATFGRMSGTAGRGACR